MTGVIADDTLALNATAKFNFFVSVIDDFVRKNFELLSGFVQLNFESNVKIYFKRVRFVMKIVDLPTRDILDGLELFYQNLSIRKPQTVLVRALRYRV